MNIKSIWEVEERFWPKAARDYVFLAAAFHEVGQRLCGNDWTGREALPVAWPQHEAWRKWESAKRLAALPPPPVTLGNYRAGGGPVIRKAETVKSDPEKLAAVEQGYASRILTEREANDAMTARRYLAASWIAERGRNNELPTFGIGMGWAADPRPLNASIWNASDDWALFAGCESRVFVNSVSVTLPLFVSRAGLDSCLEAIPTATRSRKPHASAIDDKPLLIEMQKLVADGEATGPYQAALLVADSAAGGGTVESKVRRLEKKYIAEFGK